MDEELVRMARDRARVGTLIDADAPRRVHRLRQVRGRERRLAA